MVFTMIAAAIFTGTMVREATAAVVSGMAAGDREAKTVSGTISAIGDASFKVDVKRDRNIESVEFLIDDATRFEGKLEMGAQATVQFRTAEGNNIAIHVNVQAANS